MKNKIEKVGWTSKKQAKKLVDAGLDVNTADMAYRRFRVGRGFEWQPECVPYKNYLKKDDDGGSFPINLIKPCWSLGALIDLMPNFTMLCLTDYFVKQWMITEQPLQAVCFRIK